MKAASKFVSLTSFYSRTATVKMKIKWQVKAIFN